jgi:hypothetical protein
LLPYPTTNTKHWFIAGVMPSRVENIHI